MPQETITIELDTSNDLGFWRQGQSSLSFLQSNAQFGYYLPSSQLYASSFRYKLPLTHYDQVDEVVLLLQADENTQYSVSPSDGVNLTLNGHDTDDSSQLSTYSAAESASGGSATSAHVTTFLGYTSYLENFEVGDFKTVIAEIIGRVGWTPNNYITLFVKSSVPSGVTGSNWRSYKFGAGSTYAPKLRVKYTPGINVAGDQTVIHDLMIMQDIHAFWHKKSVESVLNITQDVTNTVHPVRNVVHTLTIVSTPHAHIPINKEVMHLVLPTQDIQGSKTKTKTVESVLSITHEIHGNSRLNKNVTSTLSITHDITPNRSYTLSVESLVAFVQTMTTNIHTREITHGVSITPTIGVTSNLQQYTPNMSTLVLTQVIGQNTSRTRAVEHTLTIKQSILGYSDHRTGGLGSGPSGVGDQPPGGGGAPGGGSPQSPSDPGAGTGQGRTPSPDIVKEYSPASDGSVGFPTVPTLEPEPVPITLAYPTTSPSLSITLPAPLFSNREELQLTRVQRHTRGGVLKTFSEDTWPKVRTFRYKFDSLTTDKTEEFFTFLSQTLGLKVRLTDYEGRQWDGFIVNSAGESAQFFRVCGKTTEFDFDGVEV